MEEVDAYLIKNSKGEGEKRRRNTVGGGTLTSS